MIVGPSCSEPLIARDRIEARMKPRMRSKAVFLAKKRLSAMRAMQTAALRKFDLHTHYYPTIYFDKIRDLARQYTDIVKMFRAGG